MADIAAIPGDLARGARTGAPAPDLAAAAPPASLPPRTAPGTAPDASDLALALPLSVEDSPAAPGAMDGGAGPDRRPPAAGAPDGTPEGPAPSLMSAGPDIARPGADASDPAPSGAATGETAIALAPPPARTVPDAATPRPAPEMQTAAPAAADPAGDAPAPGGLAGSGLPAEGLGGSAIDAAVAAALGVADPDLSLNAPPAAAAPEGRETALAPEMLTRAPGPAAGRTAPEAADDAAAVAAGADATTDAPVADRAAPGAMPPGAEPAPVAPETLIAGPAPTDGAAPDRPAGAPPGALDDVEVAAIDPVTRSPDASPLDTGTLTDGDTADARPATPLAPAPAGTAFERDARGLVVATEDGALTPAGIRVVAGSPGRRPPDRPPYAATPDDAADGAVDTAANATSNATADPGADTAADPAAELALSEAGARVGPARGSAPDAAVSSASLWDEPTTATDLNGRTRAELADLTPLRRPASDRIAALTEDSAPTDEAVAASPRPTLRPARLAAAVANARVGPSGVATAAAQVSTVRQIPSGGSVSRTATFADAIELGRINLVGVYGSSKNRRALVRLPNGRFVKVQAGDRLDGGSVRQINASSIDYVKGGRTHRLAIPAS